MTIAGCYVAGPDLALLWSDTEVFAGARSSGHSNKLTVSAGGAMACTGAGWASLNDAAAQIVSRALDVDDAASRMGEPLRQTALRMCRDPHRDPADIARHTVCLAGWSGRSRRVLAYECGGGALFQAVLTTRYASPEPDDWIAGFRPDDPRSLAALAQRQLGKLRQTWPEAQGGTLALAVIRPGHVEAGPFLDFGTGRLLWPGLTGSCHAEAEPPASGLAIEGPAERVVEAA